MPRWKSERSREEAFWTKGELDRIVREYNSVFGIAQNDIDYNPTEIIDTLNQIRHMRRHLDRTLDKLQQNIIENLLDSDRE